MTIRLKTQHGLGLLLAMNCLFSSAEPLPANEATSAANTMQLAAPEPGSLPCTEADFGAVQIRIGLHATLKACFRAVELGGTQGTAFVSVPREFENRHLTRTEFDRFRAGIVETENAFRRTEDEHRKKRQRGDSDARKAQAAVPLGIFDDAPDRVGYAYAYALSERGDDGKTRIQTMLRAESFVLVNGRVLLLMLITPVADGNMAADTFDLSENWAKAIVAANGEARQASRQLN